MKKTLFVIAGSFILATSCTKSTITDNATETNEQLSGRKCASADVLEQQLAANPALANRMNEIEAFTNQFISNSAAQQRLIAGGIIEIPVVVNVLYKTEAENISAQQIQSQIDILNKDFRATNSDVNNTPAIFKPVLSGDIGIRFVLVNTVRKATNKTSWKTNDAMKKSNRGGIDATSPTTTLNLWCCNLSGGILGYAQFPGGNAETDGVVIDNNAFGNMGTVTAPYNQGRTATHEVGHWMNLRHIWGDATCGNDLVDDTPLHNTPNFGCPAPNHRSTCSGTPIEMTMNYMDYTDDACMYMFTTGQKLRMQAVFASGGARSSFAQP